RTCTIITCEASAALAPLHARMPVILAAESYADWLRPESGDARALRALLRPFESAPFNAQAVSTIVNNARIDSVECVRPLNPIDEAPV
ncbi:MAG: SOS response-associated peptidase family protein, partial [Chloroflexi bacterium]|nr:SOS response-associated peptidase family protein [Chloroflexota bacterium]